MTRISTHQHCLWNTTGYHPGPVAPPCADGAPLNKTILVFLPFLNLLLLEPQSFSNKIFFNLRVATDLKNLSSDEFLSRKAPFSQPGSDSETAICIFCQNFFLMQERIFSLLEPFKANPKCLWASLVSKVAKKFLQVLESFAKRYVLRFPKTLSRMTKLRDESSQPSSKPWVISELSKFHQ